MSLTQVQSGMLNSDSQNYGFKNRIINGDMRIDQRNAGASVTANDGTYSVDRWMCVATANGKFTMQQNAGSVTPPTGYTNYLGCISTAATSLGVTDFYHVRQRIEGFNVADLGWGTSNAQVITLSFWVRSSLTGIFGGSINNSAFSRSYPFSYTISSANTWEQKTITINGDTSGTWLTTNAVGIQLSFSLGSGSTYSGTAGAWSGSTFTSTTSATSVVGTNGATFYITGVQLEKGTTATSFDYRAYGTEFSLCQRYFYAIKSSGASNGDATGLNGVIGGATSVHRSQTPNPVTMRTNPSLTFSNVSTQGTDLRVYDAGVSPNITSVGTNFSNANAIQFDCTASAGGLTTGRAGTVLWQNSITGGYIWVSAEL